VYYGLNHGTPKQPYSVTKAKKSIRSDGR